MVASFPVSRLYAWFVFSEPALPRWRTTNIEVAQRGKRVRLPFFLKRKRGVVGYLQGSLPVSSAVDLVPWAECVSQGCRLS